jgi:hypothetical protein
MVSEDYFLSLAATSTLPTDQGLIFSVASTCGDSGAQRNEQH